MRYFRNKDTQKLCIFVCGAHNPELELDMVVYELDKNLFVLPLSIFNDRFYEQHSDEDNYDCPLCGSYS